MAPLHPSINKVEGAGPRLAHNSELGITLSSVHDGGNVEVVDLSRLDDIQLRIRPDPYCEVDKRSHLQWFSFRAAGARGRPLVLRILNANEASFPEAWEGYQACASYDLEDWFRVPTSYNASQGELVIQHTPERDACHYAYFAPYPMERHARLIHRMQARDGVQLRVLGHSVEGRDMELLQIGGEPGEAKPRLWLIARQHPGETMAEHFMEGFLERLTQQQHPDDAARALLQQAVVYAVPNMCPDGSARGHLRTNAVGVNLNRAWAEPDAETSPEVHCVLREMDRVGVDFLLDVHGDEELPYVFVVRMDGVPSFNERLERLEEAFCTAFKRAAPAFQTEHGYPTDAPGQANLTVASKQVGERFKCLSLTLEMPFKDTANLPEPKAGWTPQRSAALGAALVNALLEVVPQLRA